MPPQVEDRRVYPVQSQQKLYKDVYKNVQGSGGFIRAFAQFNAA